jgi:NADPH2 dehydrogenase
MTAGAILRIGSLKDVGGFQDHLRALDLQIPCDPQVVTGTQSPLRQPLERGPFKIGNRIAVQPMEGWDATPDGAPSENTVRRWRRFGRSGGKLIWGGEAVAVSHEGRANPNQLLASHRTQQGLEHLRTVWCASIF